MLGRRDFGNRDELAADFADAIAGRLRTGIAEHGAASLAVSGGTTPALFFKALSRHDDVDWDKVVVTLVDERWVDETSDRSNARLVKADLLQGPAAAATFVPLYSGGDEPDDAALVRTRKALEAVPIPFEVVILGMGADGHTASFFPGGDNLRQALGDDVDVLAMHAPGAGEPRVTLSLNKLMHTRGLYLHIEGEEKAKVLDMALAIGSAEDMPIRAVLRQTELPVTVYWCP